LLKNLLIANIERLTKKDFLVRIRVRITGVLNFKILDNKNGFELQGRGAKTLEINNEDSSTIL
jgi:hypothetical protein